MGFVRSAPEWPGAQVREALDAAVGALLDGEGVPPEQRELLLRGLDYANERRRFCEVVRRLARVTAQRIEDGTLVEAAGPPEATPVATTSAAPADAVAAPPPVAAATPDVVASAPVSETPATTVAVATMPVPRRSERLFPVVHPPNATANRAYAAPLPVPQLGTDYELVEARGLDGSGLAFDPTLPGLRGTPLGTPGQTSTLKLQLQVRARGGGAADPQTDYVAHVELLVNADPRTLWKDLPSDTTDPHWKPERIAQRLPAGGRVLAAASVRGRSHANVGSFRDDDFVLHHDAASLWTVVAVADGAGSATCSRRGSQIACATAVETLRAQLDALQAGLAPLLAGGPPESGEPLRLACAGALDAAARAACEAIDAEARAQQREPRDYSTTLLLAAHRRFEQGELVACWWVGDGAPAVFTLDGPAVELLGAADTGEFSGQTRFLAPDAFDGEPGARVRCALLPSFTALVLMSDGVSDPKFPTDRALRDPENWRRWWCDDLGATVRLSRDNHRLADELLAWLDFWSPGEHDDRTLAVLL